MNENDPVWVHVKILSQGTVVGEGDMLFKDATQALAFEVNFNATNTLRMHLTFHPEEVVKAADLDADVFQDIPSLVELLAEKSSEIDDKSAVGRTMVHAWTERTEEAEERSAYVRERLSQMMSETLGLEVSQEDIADLLDRAQAFGKQMREKNQ